MSYKEATGGTRKDASEKYGEDIIEVQYLESSSLHSSVSSTKNVLLMGGKKYLDSNGGFLVEEESKRVEERISVTHSDSFFDAELCTCDECGKSFATSYLFDTFDYPVCDGCRDNEGKHTLITKTEAKSEYFLKNCDFDLRTPPLKCIERPNPHNQNWGQMKLYLVPQVKMRALEVWGTMENIESMHDKKEEKRAKLQEKKYNNNLKALRKEMRSSLYNRIKGPVHSHTFSSEQYNEEDDTYSKTCTTCGFVETYEKM